MPDFNQPEADEDYLISGEVDDFAIEDDTSDDAGIADEDQTTETKLIQEIRKYLKEQIKTHNSFDAIEPQAEQIMTTQQQVQMHKSVVIHLRQIQNMINDKVREN